MASTHKAVCARVVWGVTAVGLVTSSVVCGSVRAACCEPLLTGGCVVWGCTDAWTCFDLSE